MDDSERANRRELRKEFIALAAPFIGLISLLGNILGYSALANIWSGIALLAGGLLICMAIVLHDRGASGLISRNYPSPLLTRFSTTIARPPYLLSVVALLLIVGAWLEANLGNIVKITLYGGINDLDVRSPANVAEPATIALRRNGSSTCFFTQATFDLKNATSASMRVGLISASLDMQDNANAPVLVGHNLADVRSQNEFLSGIAVVTGAAEGWVAKISQDKEQLTFLGSGQTVRITVRQEDFFGHECVNDANATLYKTYSGNVVRVTAGIAIIRGNGSIERQDISSGDLPAKVQRQ